MSLDLHMTSPDTRFSLIARLHDPRDAEAWQEFVQLYQPLIFRIALKRGLQHADAAEVAQEVLTRVHTRIDSWNPQKEKGSFRGWLYCITRNLTIDFLRRKKLPVQNNDWDSRSLPLDALQDPSEQESREFYLEYERQLFAWAAKAVQSDFQESTWRAFWMTAVDGIAVNEVSKRMNMSPGAIYVARSRVMQRLTRKIESRLNDSQDRQEQK